MTEEKKRSGDHGDEVADAGIDEPPQPPPPRYPPPTTYHEVHQWKATRERLERLDLEIQHQDMTARQDEELAKRAMFTKIMGDDIVDSFQDLAVTVAKLCREFVPDDITRAVKPREASCHGTSTDVPIPAKLGELISDYFDEAVTEQHIQVSTYNSIGLMMMQKS